MKESKSNRIALGDRIAIQIRDARQMPRPKLKQFDIMPMRPVFPDCCAEWVINLCNERNELANSEFESDEFESVSYDELEDDDFG